MSQEKFIELITKELLGELTSDEYRELMLLLKKDPGYAKQRANFKMYWESDQENKSDDQALFQKITTTIRETEPEFNIEKSLQIRKKLFPILWKVAAVLIVVSSVYLYKISSSVTLDKKALSVQTVSGEKRVLILSDGTKVTINAASKLSYPASFKDSIREVYLKGEAFFDVKKDRLHPFVIHTGKMDIRVLGTAFNVKAYGNDKFSETTLIHGSVQVTLTDRPKDRIILKPTEKLVVKYPDPVKKETADVEDMPNALPAISYMQKKDNIVIETSWLQSKMIFKDEDFESLTNSLERQYGTKIQFQNMHLKDLRFSGVFEKESLTEVLSALQLTENFNFKVVKDKIIIY
ncbi:FecR family protein [Pedobacter frigidisoli]|uniref:FecR family protein n=1 Tax=Pedobacter frigidisoli TaxID=2530455 RepID=A0A4R0NW39_9SPHI|nr:FecR domain-containing protein [Pedobacter frigidisoli]TCD05900.1 FecR family protein [Pedobacter frigidisoli]